MWCRAERRPCIDADEVGQEWMHEQCQRRKSAALYIIFLPPSFPCHNGVLPWYQPKRAGAGYWRRSLKARSMMATRSGESPRDEASGYLVYRDRDRGTVRAHPELTRPRSTRLVLAKLWPKSLREAVWSIVDFTVIYVGTEFWNEGRDKASRQLSALR